MNEKTSGLFIYLVIFWGVVILLNVALSAYIGYSTNADLDSLEVDTINFADLDAENPFTNIFRIMFFQVSGNSMFFVGLILDIVAILSAYVVLSMIFNR